MTESSRQAEGDNDQGDTEVDGTHGGEAHVEVEKVSVIDSGSPLPTNSKYELDNDQVKDPAMSVMTLALPSIPLHSPSNIIGTPFATDSESAPYEYPFPDPSANSSSDRDGLPSSSSSTNLSHSSSFPSLLSGSSFQVSSSSSLLPSLASTSPSTSPMSHFPLVSHTYSSTHPKLRPINPPVPPALMKKRQRWSLGLLRRRSSSGSLSSVGPLSSPEALSDTSEQVSGAFRLEPKNQVTIDSHQQRNTTMGENDTPVQQLD